MSDSTTKIVREQGGEALTVKDGGDVNVESGGDINLASGADINVASGAAIVVDGEDITAEVKALSGTTADAADLNKIDVTTNGTVQASKAIVVDTNKDYTGVRNSTQTGFSDVQTLKVDNVTMSPLKWVDVTVTAALLDSAGSVNVIAGVAGDQYKVRDIRLVGGGTNFGSGGDRLIDLTDGTTVWTQIANADIESAPTATLPWGNTKVPFLTSTSDTASVAGQAIRFQYSGGTTDHSATGSIKFSVCLEKVA